MDFRKIRIVLACLTGLSLTAPVAVYAGAESGFYLGGGVGNTTVDGNNFNASDSSYKVFGGYNIGFIPLVDFAVEASYVDFGKPSTNNASIDLSGVDAFGLAGLSFGPIGIFVKAGMVDWSLDASNSATGASSSDSGSDPAYGVGARFAVGSFAVRVEYEVFDVNSEYDFSMASASAVFTF